MPAQGPLDYLPLWAFFAATVVLVLLSIEVGFRIGRLRATSKDHENEASVGAMANASLALLAFLLAFTFGFAASRLEARRTVLLDEVNAIGTTYLRAATLPEPERTQAQTLLREYAETRLDAAKSEKLLEAALVRSTDLQTQLWHSAAALAARNPNAVVYGLYLETLNEMIDLHAKRLNEGLRVRVPAIIWAVLFALTALAMGEMGYQMGLSSPQRSRSVPVFALAFSVVIFLIADLDRPYSGWVRVNQLPMQELLDSMPPPAPQ